MAAKWRHASYDIHITKGPELAKTPIRPHCTALEILKEGTHFGLLTAFYFISFTALPSWALHATRKYFRNA